MQSLRRLAIDSLGRILARWRTLPHWKRDWAFNVCLGVLIEIGLQTLHHSPVVVAAQNWTLDKAMQLRSVASVGRDTSVHQLALIDVDEETWRDPNWGGGEPDRAPRPKLLQLIDFALTSNARYVVLDVAVEGTTDTDGFAAAIAQRAPMLAARKQHILFARTLRRPIYSNPTIASDWRESPLDAVIDAHPAQLHSVAPYFVLASDGVVREWLLWQTACKQVVLDGSRHWQVLPSVQLVVASLEKAGSAAVANLPWDQFPAVGPCRVSFEGVSAKLAPARQIKATIDSDMWKILSEPPLNFGQAHGEAHSDSAIDLRNRIAFRFGASSRSRPSEQIAVETPAVTVIPALEIVTQRSLKHDFGAGTVVIAQSFDQAHDFHATPIGEMSGGMVILNSISSMISPGLLRPIGEVPHLLIQVLLILAVAFVFAYFHSWRGTLLLTVLLVPVLIIMNYTFFSFGIWFDYAVPLLGIAAHRVWEGIHEKFEKWFGTARHG